MISPPQNTYTGAGGAEAEGSTVIDNCHVPAETGHGLGGLLKYLLTLRFSKKYRNA